MGSQILEQGSISYRNQIVVKGSFKKMNDFESAFSQVKIRFSDGDLLDAKYTNGQLDKATLFTSAETRYLNASSLPLAIYNTDPVLKHRPILELSTSQGEELKTLLNDQCKIDDGPVSGKIIGSDWIYVGGLDTAKQPEGLGMRISTRGVFYSISHKKNGKVHGPQIELSFGFHKFFRQSIYKRGLLEWAKTLYANGDAFESLSNLHVGRLSLRLPKSTQTRYIYGEVRNRDVPETRVKRRSRVSGLSRFEAWSQLVFESCSRKFVADSQRDSGVLKKQKQVIEEYELEAKPATQQKSQKELEKQLKQQDRNFGVYEQILKGNLQGYQRRVSELEARVESMQRDLDTLRAENQNLKRALAKQTLEDSRPTRESSEKLISKRASLKKGSFTSFANFETSPVIETSNLACLGNLRHFNGQILNGLKQGYCEEEFHDGAVYKGYYRDNLRQGTGMLRTEAFEYKGNFEDGVFEGTGEKQLLQEQMTLVGQFRRGLYCGSSLLIRGMKYNGQIRAEQMHGEGTLTLGARFEFKGMFLKNKVFVGQTQAQLKDKENEESYTVAVYPGEKPAEVLFVAQNNLVFSFDQEKGRSISGPFFRNMDRNRFHMNN